MILKLNEKEYELRFPNSVIRKICKKYNWSFADIITKIEKVGLDLSPDQVFYIMLYGLQYNNKINEGEFEKLLDACDYNEGDLLEFIITELLESFPDFKKKMTEMKGLITTKILTD